MKIKLIAVLAIVATVTGAQNSQASIQLVFGPGGEFSGSGGVLSGQVLVTIANSGANNVDVTINAAGLDPLLSEFITGLYLNLNPVLDPLDLTFATDGSTPPEPTSVDLGTDSFQADGDGLFDIRINYPTAPPGDRFVSGDMDTVTFSLTGLTESDFFPFDSAPGGGHGPFTAALRVQGLGADGEGSGWFAPIPEAASIVVWSLLVCVMVGFRRMRSTT